MKTLKNLLYISLTATLFIACSSDDDTPTPINQEEVITTMTITLEPQGPGNTVTLQTQDLDGDGPNPPMITISGDLSTSTVYNGSIVLLNETEDPADNITLEVQAEDEDHQFFFIADTQTSTVDVAYADTDGEGNPIGLSFTLTTNDATSFDLRVVLRHELDKNAEGVSEGDIANAGGETDIDTTFENIVVAL